MVRVKLLLVVILFSILNSCTSKSGEIIVCGEDKVVIFERNSSDSKSLIPVWRWQVSDVTDMPDVYQKYMIPTDDCRPVDQNTKILITSSGGGVALVSRKTKQTLFYAHAPMAHSAEYLPNGRIVVALSTASGGNSIELYDVNKSEKVIFKDSLYSGHGVVWMPEMKRLFALGFDELRSYSLKDWDSEKPELQLMKKWKLPDNGGHDLISISETELVLTTSNNVWVFNTQDEQFSAFGLLNEEKNVKSVNYNESTTELIYTKGEESWWTHNIYCKNPENKYTIPDIKLYKVRIISD
jgi:uncharacterized protein DUF6528